MQSGYRDSDGARMHNFLACWKQQTTHFVDTRGQNTLYNATSIAEHNEKLTPSVLNFYREASRVGWLSAFDAKHKNRFKSIGDIKLFKESEPLSYEILKASPPENNPPDAQYYVYNKSQSGDLDSLIRWNELDSMLNIGGEGHGIIYNLIPNEKSLDGEFQALFYSPHGLIVKFKSFAHLLVNLYLEEYQRLRGLDGSMGHIFYFKGDWKDTCVPLLFDMEEIESWKERVPGDNYRAPFSS